MLLILFVLPDNEVDGMELMHLTNSDINMMLPGKVGAAHKLTVVIEQLKSSQTGGNPPVNAVSDNAVSSKSVQNGKTPHTSSVGTNEVNFPLLLA